jgi:hypothetical protein
MPNSLGFLHLELTESEVTELHHLLDSILPQLVKDGQNVPSELCAVASKTHSLYEENCVKYRLTPACKAYIEKYGETPAGDLERWETFKDNYDTLVELGFLP